MKCYKILLGKVYQCKSKLYPYHRLKFLFSDLCAGMGEPPENTEFIVTFDKSEVVSGNVNNHEQCKQACTDESSCIGWTFYPKEQICRIEKETPDSNSGSGTPRCALGESFKSTGTLGRVSFASDDFILLTFLFGLFSKEQVNEQNQLTHPSFRKQK